MVDGSTGAVEYLRNWATKHEIAETDIERVITGLEAVEQGKRPQNEDDASDPTYALPGLTSVPWWNLQEFPWVDSLLKQANSIRNEYFTVSARLNRTQALENPKNSGRLRASGKWNTAQLFHRGVRQSLADQFPITVSSLRKITDPSCGMEFFSTLEPGSRIEPHTGYTNAHLRAHLVIKSNESAQLRVANEWRAWKDFEVLIFDDTFEHEAVNDCHEQRVVLLFDIWHPELTVAERKAFQSSTDFLRKASVRQHLLNSLARS